MISNLIKKNKLIFIAEIGMNHNGNFDLSYELIRQAKINGADAVKFQLGWRNKKGEINQITDEIINKLIKISKYFDIELFFSIIDDDALIKARRFNFKTYKIASRTIKYNFELAKKIIKLNKETIVSLGMWNKRGLPFKKSSKIKYLWCKSEYPLYPWNIKNFPKSFSQKNFYGYSDHTVGIEMCLIAICRGAKIIEKHFTLDKSDTTIRDHCLSATPNEFRNLVELGKEIEKKINLKI